MADCYECKHAVWDCVEFLGEGRHFFVSDCKLGNNEEDCEDFEEYLPPLPDGF